MVLTPCIASILNVLSKSCMIYLLIRRNVTNSVLVFNSCMMMNYLFLIFRQGLNRLVAIALLFLREEDAFWCLVAIIEFIMPPEYYTNTLMSAQVDQVISDSI